MLFCSYFGRFLFCNFLILISFLSSSVLICFFGFIYLLCDIFRAKICLINGRFDIFDCINFWEKYSLLRAKFLFFWGLLILHFIRTEPTYLNLMSFGFTFIILNIFLRNNIFARHSSSCAIFNPFLIVFDTIILVRFQAHIFFITLFDQASALIWRLKLTKIHRVCKVR